MLKIVNILYNQIFDQNLHSFWLWWSELMLEYKFNNYIIKRIKSFIIKKRGCIYIYRIYQNQFFYLK